MQSIPEPPISPTSELHSEEKFEEAVAGGPHHPFLAILGVTTLNVLRPAGRPVTCAVLLCLWYVAAAGAAPEAGAQAALEPARVLAEEVMIYRDGYGVPHVYAETDEGAVFGFLFAQAEDDFWQVEDNIIRALGRGAEVYGESAVNADILTRALRVPELARREYAQLEPEIQRLSDAAAAGLNYYLRANPDVETRLIRRFEPWHFLALLKWMRRQTIYDNYANSHGLSPGQDLRSGSPPDLDSKTGSNGWAIAPSHSASGHALLVGLPHLGFTGSERFYEGHVRSEEGLRISGATFFGFPVIHMGYTPRIGFVATDAYPDQADFYVETFDDPDRPLAYRYGDSYRRAEEWTDSLAVTTDSGMVTRRYTFRRTHHGPIVGTWEGKPVAVKIARLEEGGVLRQMYTKARARNLREFKAALRLPAYNMNWVYADRDGNIFFAYTGAIPVRNEAYDWSRPVDGSDPGTEWQGWHTLAEMPQVTNPSSGFLFSTNQSPFDVSVTDAPDPAAFPEYMRNETFIATQTVRSDVSREILSSDSSITVKELEALAFDRTVRTAPEEIPKLVDDWMELRDVAPERAARLKPAIELLRSWDGVSRTESEAMTLFTLWYTPAHPDEYPDFVVGLMNRWLAGWSGTVDPQSTSLDILERVMFRLEEEWGTWHVPYGELARIQRVRDPGSFSDESRSLPVAGADMLLGQIFFVAPVPLPGRQRRYALAGQSYVGIQEFGETIDARSVTVFGQSSDPDSPHYFDQAPLFVRGEFKQAWLTRAEVEEVAERAYHPGGR